MQENVAANYDADGKDDLQEGHPHSFSPGTPVSLSSGAVARRHPANYAP
jgi:hypothetical protein